MALMGNRKEFVAKFAEVLNILGLKQPQNGVAVTTEDAKKEAIMMLGAVRRSFKTIPTAEGVTPIKA
jgi:hypothetical protein